MLSIDDIPVGGFKKASESKAVDKEGLYKQLYNEQGLPKTPYDDLMTSAAEEHGVPYEVLYRNLKQESRFDPNAISWRVDKKTGKKVPNARGIAQFIPSTARDMGVKDPHDPKQAIPGAAKYIRQLYDRFGDWKLAIAAYNAGPEAVEKHKGIPPYDETQKHVKAVFPDDDSVPSVSSSSNETRFMPATEFAKTLFDEPVATAPEPSESRFVSDKQPKSSFGLSTKEYYSSTAIAPPFQGIGMLGFRSPEINTYMYKKFGIGPKVIIDELGRPVDEKGNPFTEAEPNRGFIQGIIADTFKGLGGLVTHPDRAAMGLYNLMAAMPGFMLGVIGGAGRAGKELIDQLAYTDVEPMSRAIDIMHGISEEEPGEPKRKINFEQVYNALMGGIEEGMKFYKPAQDVISFPETKESVLSAEVAMAPYIASTGTAKEISNIELFKDSPNVRGLIKIFGEGFGLALNGFLLHGSSRRAEFAKQTTEVVKEATALRDRAVNLETIPETLLREIERKKLEIDKQRLEAKATQFAEKFHDDILVIEEMGRQAEEVAKAKSRPVTYSRKEMTGRAPEIVEGKEATIAEQPSVPAPAPEPVKPEVKVIRRKKAAESESTKHPEFGELWTGRSERPPGTKANRELGRKSRYTTWLGNGLYLTDYKSARNYSLYEGSGKSPTTSRWSIEGRGFDFANVPEKELKAIIDKVLPYSEENKWKRAGLLSANKMELYDRLADTVGSANEFNKVLKDLGYTHVIDRRSEGSHPWQILVFDKSKSKEIESKLELAPSKPESVKKFNELPDGQGFEVLDPETGKPLARMETREAAERYWENAFGEEKPLSPEEMRVLDNLIEEAEAPVETTRKAEPPKLPSEQIDYFGERKIVNEIDRAAGERVPELEEPTGAFMRSQKEVDNLHRIYEERAKSVAEDPELFTQKLINDARRWYYGNKEVNIDSIRSMLSELSSRSNELRDKFMTGVDHLQWAETVSEAAKWARGLERAKVGEPVGTRLNMMIPVDQIPASVRLAFKTIFGGTKAALKDVIRNRKLFDATGFWFGRDGKWRYEIDDSKANYFPSKNMRENYKATGEASGLLTDVLDYPDLYKAVPELKDLKVTFTKTLPKNGTYLPAMNTILIKSMGDKKTLFHELQHVVNKELGSSFLGTAPALAEFQLLKERLRLVLPNVKTKKGVDTVKWMLDKAEENYIPNVDYLEKHKGTLGISDAQIEYLREPLVEKAFENYKRDPGEMESRLTEARMNMSAKERLETPPWETLDKMLVKEGRAPSIGQKLYSGVPFDQVAKLVKKGWKELREDQEMFTDQVKGWLMGFRKDMPEPDKLYRGVYKGSGVRSTSELHHGTPWAYDAARGGKGAFGDPSSHDVYEIPASKDVKYYRGGSLAGDPLERTRIDSVKGMTWEQVMNKAKELYYQDLTKLRAQERKFGREVEASDEMVIADRIAGDIRRATFETDLGGGKGIWSEFGPDRDLARDYPKLRHIDVVRDVAEAKRRLGYTDAQIPELKILGEVPKTKFYSGVPLDEAAKAIAEGSRKVVDYIRKSRDYKKFKPKEAYKITVDQLNNAINSKSGNSRRELLKGLGDDGYKVIQSLYLSRGGSARSSMYLDQLKKEVYSGLDSGLKEIVDSVILSTRMIDIAGYKTPGKDFVFPDGRKLTDFIGLLNAFDKKEFNGIRNLTPSEKIDVTRRVKSYFDWMKKALTDLKDEGLITEKEYNDLIKHNYRRLESVDKIYDKPYKVKVGGKTITVHDSGIESLQRGKKTDIYEGSSELMALEVFNRTYGRIMKNRANLSLLDVARKFPDNPFVRVREKGKKLPPGWSTVLVVEDGVRKAIHLAPEFAKEWITSSPDVSYRAGRVMQYAFGTPLLRLFATGIEWSFAAANLIKDLWHIEYAAQAFENGKWKQIYNPVKPIYGLQIGADINAVFNDALNKTGRYRDYINEGGGMEFLVHQGRLFRRGQHLESTAGGVLDKLGRPGEVSELMTRLAIRERVIKRRAKQLGISVEEARKNKDITKEATFVARDYMDFGDKGWLTQIADNAIPYVGATVAATRGLFRAFKPGRGSAFESTFRMSQFGTLVGGLTAATIILAPKTNEELKGDDRVKDNLIIPLGDKFGFEDEYGDMRYMFLKIPIDSSQKFFKAFFDATTRRALGEEIDPVEVAKTLKELSPVDISSLPPTVAAALGYWNNTNYWRNEPIVREPFSYPKSAAEWDRRTPELYKDIGGLTGLSPERTKYAVGQLITSGGMWGSLVTGGYERAFGNVPGPDRQRHIAQILADTPILKRFFGITNPYAKHGKKIDKAEEEARLNNFIQTRNMDTKVFGYLYDKNVSLDEVTSYAESFGDKDTYDKLMDRFKWEVAIKDLPEKSFWRRMKGLPVEARARVFVDRLNSADEGERQKLMEELGIVMNAKGIISKEFKKEVTRLMEGQ